MRQIIAQGKAGDGLIGISTSGNSSNLIAAFAKAKEMGIVTIGLVRRRRRQDEIERRVRSLLGRAHDRRSIASRSATSPPITSFGISCTRCSPTTADRRREGGGGMKYVDEFRDRDKAQILVKDIERLVARNKDRRSAGRSRSWKCAAAIRIRSSATASKACCRKRSSWCMDRAVRFACCRWGASTIASRLPSTRE